MYFMKMKTELLFNISTNTVFYVYLSILNKFRSRRRGFQGYVIGQLKECASRFYKEEISVRVQNDLSTKECNHFIKSIKMKVLFLDTIIVFRVDFNNSAVKETSKRFLNVPNLPDIRGETFFTIFPFTLVINPSMRISHMGRSIKNLFPFNTILIERYLGDVFRLIRPDIELEWNKVNYLFDRYLFFNIVLCILRYLVMVDILFL